jgi:hypothetical protein
METKNLMEAWVDSQSKLINNWIEASKKLQESLQKGDVMEKGPEIYKDLFGKQREIMEKVSGMTTNDKSQSIPTSSPDWMKEMMTLQNQALKGWIDMFQQAGHPASMSANPMEMMMGEARKMYDTWNNLYEKMYAQLSKPWGDFKLPGSANMGMDTVTEAYQNMLNASRTYMQMFELWKPLYKMMQQDNPYMENMIKAVDMEKYKEIMDNMFTWVSPQKGKEVYEQVNKYVQMYAEPVKNMQEEMYRQMKEMSGNVPALMEKYTDTYVDMSQQLMEQYNKLSSPVMSMLPAGKEKEMMQAVMHLQEKATRYFVKSAEIQQMVYAAGQNALEKSMTTAMDKVNSGEQITFDEFYKQWMNILEDSMTKTFNGTAFSKTQGEMLQIGSEIKKNMEIQMEYMLAPYPVAPRSEVDQLNTTIQELKSKIMLLEKQSEVSEEEEKHSKKK